eukprot:TRINITY_DN6460_c0_g1_i2.p1 TRINITY_DN6460_c0_g1~~TRINITY_DN6460_c0_g1_i2.p1  ORF type:complete len:429 (+),score=126.55 TRINITY_DN6460_c0_g1_i2:98-1384(+)
MTNKKIKDSHGKGLAARKVPFGIQNAAGGNVKDFKEVFPKLYSHPQSPDAYDHIRRTLFSPQDWIENQRNFSSLRKFDLIKKLRQLVQVGTIEACLRGRYFIAEKHVNLDVKIIENSVRNTVFHDDNFEYVIKPVKRRRGSKTIVAAPNKEEENKVEDPLQEKEESKPLEKKGEVEEKKETTEEKKELIVEVKEGDCLEIAEQVWKETGLKPLVLNMASSRHPGGGFESGAGAQEENLFRRTNLFQCLQDPHGIDTNRKWEYPLPEYGGLYTPEAFVFRRGEASGYAFMEEPVTFNFVSVAALRRPNLVSEEEPGKEPVMDGAGEKMMRRKIRTILNIAAHHGQTVLILSAFGCGAYSCPPRHVSRLFCEEIKSWTLEQEKKESGFKFERIVFAIFDDKNTRLDHNPQGNLLPFQNEVGKRFPIQHKQ